MSAVRVLEVWRRLGSKRYLSRAEVKELGLAAGLTMWTIRTVLARDGERPAEVRAAKIFDGRRRAMYHRGRVVRLLGLEDLLNVE